MTLAIALIAQIVLIVGFARPSPAERRLLLSEEFDSMKKWDYVVTSYRMNENQFQYYTRRPENR